LEKKTLRLATVIGTILSAGLVHAAPRGAATQLGLATYYGHSGALTAAHRTLPFGSMVHVTNKKNGRTVLVRIVDRGPKAWTGRLIDLSLGAARALDMIQTGVVPVRLLVER
jgi:rare lipoprotein A